MNAYTICRGIHQSLRIKPLPKKRISSPSETQQRRMKALENIKEEWRNEKSFGEEREEKTHSKKGTTNRQRPVEPVTEPIYPYP